MREIQLTITLPETTTATELDIKLTIASRLYENGQLSLGQAAELAGMTKRVFAELLGKYGVSLFSQTPDEVREDMCKVEDAGVRGEIERIVMEAVRGD